MFTFGKNASESIKVLIKKSSKLRIDQFIFHQYVLYYVEKAEKSVSICRITLRSNGTESRKGCKQLCSEVHNFVAKFSENTNVSTHMNYSDEKTTSHKH